MAGKPVRFHPEAEREYLSSLAWYSERSLAAALEFENEFQRAISAISGAPERWPVYLSRCRRYVLHQFPFSIVYRVLDEAVLVLAVAHGHRRPGYWSKRLNQWGIGIQFHSELWGSYPGARMVRAVKDAIVEAVWPWGNPWYHTL